MGKKMLEKLASAYIDNGGNLREAMGTAGYSTGGSNVSQMRHSDRFRMALRAEFIRREREILSDVARTGKGESRVRAIRALMVSHLGQSETHSTGGGGGSDKKDEGLPDSAW